MAEVRLREAEALFAAGLYDGSFYLCGYVVELALKACICKSLALAEYPDGEAGVRQVFKTHDFWVLALFAGLRLPIEEKQSVSAEFAGNWSIVTGWQLDDRYAIRKSRQNAQAMLEVLRSDPEGVLPWLSQRW